MWVVLALRAAIRLRTKPDQVTLGSRGRIPVKPGVPTGVLTGVLVAVLVVVPLRQATPRRVIPRQITRRQIIPRRATPVATPVVTQVVTPVVTQVVPTLAAPRPISPVSGYCFGFGIHEVPAENSAKCLNPGWHLMKRRPERKNTRRAANRNSPAALVLAIQALALELGFGSNQYPQIAENPFVHGTQNSGGVDVAAFQLL